MAKKLRYIDECKKDECRDIMEVRLNMIEAKKNFKGRHGEDVLCRACRIEEETKQSIYLNVGHTRKRREKKYIREVDIRTENTQELKRMIEYIKEVEERDRKGW